MSNINFLWNEKMGGREGGREVREGGEGSSGEEGREGCFLGEGTKHYVGSFLAKTTIFVRG